MFNLRMTSYTLTPSAIIYLLFIYSMFSGNQLHCNRYLYLSQSSPLHLLFFFTRIISLSPTLSLSISPSPSLSLSLLRYLILHLVITLLHSRSHLLSSRSHSYLNIHMCIYIPLSSSPSAPLSPPSPVAAIASIPMQCNASFEL